MMQKVPNGLTWIIEYVARRPTLARPLQPQEIKLTEIAAPDRETATRAFYDSHVGSHRIISISAR
jgi:hypothetical protein